jgi:hypothetical protein
MVQKVHSGVVVHSDGGVCEDREDRSEGLVGRFG